jgi:hypothetical protein
MRKTCALIVIGTLVGCRAALPTQPLPDHIAAFEAVFLPWWNDLSSENRKAIRAVYFPDTGDTAFPDAFFQKYRGSVPPVLRNSDLKGEQLENKDWFWGFSDLRRIDNETFEMNAGYYCGGLCARHCDYRVRRQTDGAWKIVAASSCIVS